MISLIKADSFADGAEPGKWTEFDNHILMSCPVCGKLGRLDDHQVDREGRVSPSVVCPKDGCDFHDMVKLLGWLVKRT